MNKNNTPDVKNTTTYYSTVSTILINSLICIVLLELVARIFTAGPDHQDVRTQLPYYANQAWSEQYWQEFGSIKRSYQPHTIWRRNEFNGRYINVNENGLRLSLIHI